MRCAVRSRPRGRCIGINLGDIIIEEHDIYGDGVNVAARLEALAEPGGICVSRVVRDQVRDKLDLAFEDMGEQQVKNIARPLRVYRIAIAERPLAKAPLPLPEKPSLAVLPFQNMSGDIDQDYFVDGIVEEITTAISRLPRLFVIARNSSFTYKGKAVRYYLANGTTTAFRIASRHPTICGWPIHTSFPH